MVERKPAPATQPVPIPGSVRPVEAPIVVAEPSYAGVVIRLAGLFLGLVLVAILLVGTLAVRDQLVRISIGGGLIATYGLIQWGLLATRGATVAKWMVGLRVVDVAEGRPIGWLRVALRQVTLLLLIVPTAGIGLVVNAIVIARDARHRGLHDRAAKCVEIVGGHRAGPAAAPLPTPVARVPQPAQIPWDQGPSVEDRYAESAAPSTSGAILLPDGRRLSLSQVVVVGRDPKPTDAYPTAESIAIADPTMSMSKTHAAFGVDHTGVWVHDLQSTNGTYLVRDGVVVAVATEPVSAMPGDVVNLGDLAIWIA